MDRNILWAAITRNLPHIRSAAKYSMAKYARKNRLGEVFEASDLVHDTVLKLTSNPNNVKDLGVDDKGLMALIYLTMYHIILNWARAGNIAKTHSQEGQIQKYNGFDPGADRYLGDNNHAEPEVYAQMDADDTRQRVNDAIELLSKTSPTAAIVLAYGLDVHHGDSPEVMAEHLGIPYNNYRKCRFDGIRVLRRYAA